MVLSRRARPATSLFSLCTRAPMKSFLFFARTPMAGATSPRERTGWFFTPFDSPSINDLENSNVRLVTTLVNREPPRGSNQWRGNPLDPEKLPVPASFASVLAGIGGDERRRSIYFIGRVAAYRFLVTKNSRSCSFDSPGFLAQLSARGNFQVSRRRAERFAEEGGNS